ncbi:MAG: hypothetical protein H6738_21795 [Alphaproteobacteria bacterium]|nr:hypothetical protein [Alphaproteobacteria bacterium]
MGVDARTRLAGIYDSSHMQEGGTFHERAVDFTHRLCALWSIEEHELPAYLDFILKECSASYAESMKSKLSPTESDLTGQLFAVLKDSDLADPDEHDRFVLAKRLADVATEFVSIERKRANVRGEGFADVLAWAFEKIGGLPRQYLEVRGKDAKADLVVWNYARDVPLAIVVAKWSYRHDRLDHIAASAERFKKNFEGAASLPSVILVTNEMDIPRLKKGLGIAAIDAVCLVNLALTKDIQGDRWDTDLAGHEASGRLGELSGLVQDVSARWRASEAR